ncbi:MAG: zinc-ribbon domain-containing protein [Methanoregula sp.]
MPDERVTDFCTKCGTPNTVKNQFCGKCGASLIKTDNSPIISPPQKNTIPENPEKTRRNNMLIVGGAILVLLIVALYASGILAPIMNVSTAGKYVSISGKYVSNLNSDDIILNPDGKFIMHNFGNEEKGKFSVNGNTVTLCPTIAQPGLECMISHSYQISNNQLIRFGTIYTKK